MDSVDSEAPSAIQTSTEDLAAVSIDSVEDSAMDSVVDSEAEASATEVSVVSVAVTASAAERSTK